MRLSRTQVLMLDKIGADWKRIWDVGAANCTNLTLRALEERGLVELRTDPKERTFSRWQVRRKPEAP